MSPFTDRLAEAVRKHGPLCVGLDPRWEALPKAIRDLTRPHTPDVRAAIAVNNFCTRVLELVRPFCGVVKPQAAFFEMFGTEGLAVLQLVLRRAKELGFVTILDAKRGDIASTATAYADAAFAGCSIEGETFPVWNADALTVNPYLGRDAVEPFLSAAKAGGR